jgi:nucleotide-binding universal stress UspA family protein
MYKHIMVPTDGSELSIGAAHQAIELAAQCKARMTALMISPHYHQHMGEEGFVTPVVGDVRERWQAEMTERANKVLEEICEDAAQAGVKCDTVHVFGDSPYEAIIDTAQKNGCDMIAMGSHGYGALKQLIEGSETVRVLSHTKIPVVVYR